MWVSEFLQRDCSSSIFINSRACMTRLKIVHLSGTEEVCALRLTAAFLSKCVTRREGYRLQGEQTKEQRLLLTCNQASVSGRNPLTFNVNLCVCICFLLLRGSVMFTRLCPRYVYIGLRRIEAKAQKLPGSASWHPPSACLSLRFLHCKWGK